MPTVLGAWVHDRLTEPGPVIMVEDGPWIMLTGPILADLPERRRQQALAAQAAIVNAAGVVILPGPCAQGRRWLIPPLSGDRPFHEAVFAEIGRFLSSAGI